VYADRPPVTAVNTNVEELIVVVAGVVSVAVDVSVKSLHNVLPGGWIKTVHTMFTLLWITGVVQASVDVDVGSATIVYVCDDPLIDVPPAESVTAIVYVDRSPATALNVNVEAIKDTLGVVNTSVEDRVKSEKKEVPTGCTINVQTIVTPL